MGRARTVRRRRARGNGCRAIARHLQVAQPQCTFECDMSSCVICQHIHSRTVASLDKRRRGGGFLLFLILLLSGAWIIGPPPSFSAPTPLSSEIASCSERVSNNNHTFTMPFDSTLGFPGEQKERVERESHARLHETRMFKRFPALHVQALSCLCACVGRRRAAK